MTDLDQNSTQSPRRKFSFRFPNLTHSGSHDKDSSTMSGLTNGALGSSQGGSYQGKERMNFSEAAKNVPDLQVSLTFYYFLWNFVIFYVKVNYELINVS
jgi:hypothetical protein